MPQTVFEWGHLPVVDVNEAGYLSEDSFDHEGREGVNLPDSRFGKVERAMVENMEDIIDQLRTFARFD